LGLALIGAGLLWLYFCSRPPRASKLIDDFYSRRATYERLRDLLLADEQVRAIYARWGVETVESGLPHAPGEMNFPVGRFNEYRMLLERAHSEEVFVLKEAIAEYALLLGPRVLAATRGTSILVGWSRFRSTRLPG
jgi:hypothetical protein